MTGRGQGRRTRLTIVAANSLEDDDDEDGSRSSDDDNDERRAGCRKEKRTEEILRQDRSFRFLSEKFKNSVLKLPLLRG